MDWQPIETAPRDGTVILVYADQGGHWNGIHAAKPHYSGRIGGYGHDWAIAEYQNLGKYVSGRVTHWQPLPSPPVAEETNAKTRLASKLGRSGRQMRLHQ